MMPIDPEEMSKAELVRELQKLQETARRTQSRAADDPERLIHELQVHQVELEMQNRELREAQQLLEESRARYADLYDFAPVGYCTFDRQGRIQEINLTGAALLGSPREILLERPFGSVVSMEDPRAFERHLKACLESKVRVTTEVTFSMKDRGAVIVQMVSIPARDPDGQVTGFKTALIDISTLKELERRLAFLADAGETLASPLDYRGTLAAVARLAVPVLADLCLIDVLEEDGEVQRLEVVFADASKQANLAERIKQFAERPGWQTPQTKVIASGEPLLLPHLPDRTAIDAIAHDEEHANVMLAAGIKSMMCVPLTARGRSLGALTFAAAESGRHYSSADLRFAEDIARRAAMAMDNVRLYREAQRAVHARENLLAIVSHDLKNPLGTILLSNAMFLKTVPNERRKRGRRQAEAIQRAAERMERLIRDLLDLASIDAGGLRIERRPCSSTLLATEATEAQQVLAAQKSLRISVRIEGGGADVSCDQERVQQVFANLIGNGIKFTSEGGSIDVGAQVREGEVRFWVSDSGPGIPAEDLRHIFDRFWQARAAARMGSGLGLSIAKGIIESHGGRIWAESEMGVGSTFFFTLPRVMPIAASLTLSDASNDSPPEGPVVRDKIILAVDDDLEVRGALGAMLEEEGYSIVTAANGAEALEYLRTAPPPFLILLDLKMPVMDGWAFLAERNRDPALQSIPVIVISAQREVADQVSLANARYVPKPVLPRALVETIENLSH